MADLRDPNEPIGGIGTLGDFWQWALSDLLSNTTRGLLAEYIVGRLLGADMSYPRLEWDCSDVRYRGYRIEVKASAYIQTWHRTPEQRSKLSFGIRPHTCWDAVTGEFQAEMKRWADVYVFAVFNAEPSDPRDVLDMDCWEFFVTTTQHLEAEVGPKAGTVGIARVRGICGDSVGCDDLKPRVDSLLELE